MHRDDKSHPHISHQIMILIDKYINESLSGYINYMYMGLPGAGEGRAIPRVDTFASNLHDSWGAHALHDSPPAAERGALGDPPRLSTESARSATSQASKASSGEHSSFLLLSLFPSFCLVCVVPVFVYPLLTPRS